MILNITGYYKPALLLALYRHAKYEGLGTNYAPIYKELHRDTPDHGIEMARRLLEEQGNNLDYIDLGHGPKKIKVYLLKDQCDFGLYIREHGEAALNAALADLDRSPAYNSVNTIGFFYDAKAPETTERQPHTEPTQVQL